MFIEKKDSWLFLAKKVFSKKILVKLNSYKIFKDNFNLLIKKELDIIFLKEDYLNFLDKIYNKELLNKVLIKSKDLWNVIELINSFEDKLIDSNLLWKGTFIQVWNELTFPKKFIYNSNNIEGSKIPEEEVEKIIENKKYIYKIKNEIQEVKNSIKSWDFLNSKFIFNEANIKKLYHILTKDLLQENWEKYPRWFKKVSNIVNNDITTSPEKVSEEIKDLINWYKNNKNNIFPLQLAFDFHLRYEQIHPFENGNGRTWRLLMNKILIRNWMFPMIVFTENKQSYFNAIASCKSWNKKKYYKFMLEQYKKTLDEIKI